MATYNTNELKNGLKVMIDRDPCVILECDFIKPGKGQAFTRIKVRNFKTGRVIERTHKSGDTIEAADIIETQMQYLYTDNAFWHFMVPDTYAQYTATQQAIADAKQWIKAQDLCNVILWNDEPLQVLPPNFATLSVKDTDPGVKGDTASGATKPATLETGAVVRVPLFIQIGELIKVDTRTGTYVSRVKSA